MCNSGQDARYSISVQTKLPDNTLMAFNGQVLNFLWKTALKVIHCLIFSNGIGFFMTSVSILSAKWLAQVSVESIFPSCD